MHLIAVGEAFPKDWPKILSGLQKRLEQNGSMNGKVRELKLLDFVVEEEIADKVANDLVNFKGSKLGHRMDSLKKKWFIQKLMNHMKLINIENIKTIDGFNKKSVLKDWNLDPGNSFFYLNFIGKVEDKKNQGREML